MECHQINIYVDLDRPHIPASTFELSDVGFEVGEALCAVQTKTHSKHPPPTSSSRVIRYAVCKDERLLNFLDVTFQLACACS